MEIESPEKFIFNVRVTYSDCTLGNHVYYSRYLDFLEAARGEFHRKIGVSLVGLQEAGFLFPVVECSLSYFKPARYDDWLEIRVCISLLGPVRLNFDYEIKQGEDRLVQA